MSTKNNSSSQKKSEESKNDSKKSKTQQTIEFLMKYICARLNDETPLPINRIFTSEEEIKELLETLPKHINEQFGLSFVEHNPKKHSSAISYQIENSLQMNIFIPPQKKKDFLIYSVKQRSGATKVTLPKEKWMNNLASLTPNKINFTYDIATTSITSNPISAATENPLEGKIEYKQLYQIHYTGETLKNALQVYFPPLLNYESDSLTLIAGVEDTKRSVIGIPIDLKEKENFEKQLVGFFLGNFFPPLPSKCISIIWQPVQIDFDSSGSSNFYLYPDENTENFLSTLFKQTNGKFKLYETTTIPKNYFIETYQEITDLKDHKIPKTFCLPFQEKNRHLVSIKFQLEKDEFYARFSDVYHYFLKNDELLSHNCFELWMLHHSKEIDPLIQDRLDSTLSHKMLVNLEKDEFCKNPFFKNTKIDSLNSFNGFGDFQKYVIAIIGLTQTTNSKNLIRLIKQTILASINSSQVIVCFFIKELPSFKEFPDICIFLKKNHIPWYLLRSETMIYPYNSVPASFEINTFGCAVKVQKGHVLEEQDLQQLATSYLKGNKMEILNYWDLIENHVIIKRNQIPILMKYLNSFIQEKRPFIFQINKRFHGSGATSLIYDLAYRMNETISCFILKQPSENVLKFVNELKQSKIPILLFADEFNWENYLNQIKNEHVPIILVQTSYNASINHHFIIDPFLDIELEIPQMINTCQRFFPRSKVALKELFNHIKNKTSILDRHIFTVILVSHRETYLSITEYVKEELNDLSPEDKSIVKILAFLAVYTTKTKPLLTHKFKKIPDLLTCVDKSQSVYSFWNVWLARETLLLTSKGQLKEIFETTVSFLKKEAGLTIKKFVEYLSDICFGHQQDKFSRLYRDSNQTFDSILKTIDNYFSENEKPDKLEFNAHKLLHESRIFREQDEEKDCLSTAKLALEEAEKLKIITLPFINHYGESLAHFRKFEEADKQFEKLYSLAESQNTVKQALRCLKNTDYESKWKDRTSNVKEITPYYQHEKIFLAMNTELLDKLE